MTPSEAVPGAVVVRLDRQGTRVGGIYRIVEVSREMGLCRVLLRRALPSCKRRNTNWIAIERLRLATPEERGDAR